MLNEEYRRLGRFSASGEASLRKLLARRAAKTNVPPFFPGGDRKPASGTGEVSTDEPAHAEALEGLVALGLKRGEAKAALAKATGRTAGELIASALRNR